MKLNSIIELQKRSICILSCFLLLSSCIREESSSCHKSIRIANNSQTPLRVYSVDRYLSQDTTYSFRRNAPILYPGNTMLWFETDYRDCLETDLEWAQTHPNNTYTNFETFFICDTNRPMEVHFYSTPDSVLMNYNILKKVTLIDSSISSLQKNDFVIFYP